MVFVKKGTKDVGTRKSVKRERNASSRTNAEETPIYPPLPWYAGEERNYSRYTWKSRLHESIERIRVQTAILYESLYCRLNAGNVQDDAFILKFLAKLTTGEFYTEYIQNVITFYESIEREEQNNASSTPKKKTTRKLPQMILHYLQQIPLRKDDEEPIAFDLLKIQFFTSLLPPTSVIPSLISHAMNIINLYRKQYMSFSDLTNLIETDNEPYSQFYHPAVHAARSYVTIDNYEPTSNIEPTESLKVMKKLDNPTSIHCTKDCSPSQTTLDPATFHFQSTCPCIAANQACSDLCKCKMEQHNPLNNSDLLKVGRDLLLRDSWGFDCYTRSLIQSILVLNGATPSEIQSFFQFSLYPVVNMISKEYSHDLRNGLLYLIVRNNSMKFSILLLQCFLYIGPNHFRVHPKGKGVICNKMEGIQTNQVICRYLGEVYPPWAWFEKQDVLKQKLRELDLLHCLPEFYNIVLERPMTSPDGYDVLYIDPIFRGNFGSRLSHSCNPNCATTTVTIDNRLAIVLVALRPIHCGEELTFDYSCVSESKEEFEKATCLCGYSNCRGSFVSYADDNSFMQVMNEQNNFLKRTAWLLEACSQSLTSEDRNALASAGIKHCMLDHCPDWLKKWTALTLSYMKEEEKLLPAHLVDLVDKTGRKVYTSIEHAQLEAKGVYLSRLQNLAISLDKVKHFIERQPEAYRIVTPMRILTVAEVIDFLWKGKGSVMRRLCVAGVKAFKDSDSPVCEIFAKLQIELRQSTKYTTIEAIHAYMKEVRAQLLTIQDDFTRCHLACADCLSFYIHTQTWFFYEEFTKFQSDPIPLHTYDLPCSCSTTYRLQEGQKTPVDFSLSSYCTMVYTPPTGLGNMFVGEQALNCEEELKWMNQSEEERLKETERVISYSQKVYNKQYIWGQLTTWYKQSNDPTLLLMNERKGCLLLPAIESCYANLNHIQMSYNAKKRGDLIYRVEQQSSHNWSIAFPWQYPNKQSVYGSPMFDAERGNKQCLLDVINELKQITYIERTNH